MEKLIFSIILALIVMAVIIGVHMYLKGKEKKRNLLPLAIIVPVLIIVALNIVNCFYTQDIGEAIVLKNWDGKIIGSTSETGLHTKSPLATAISYDTRNNLINFFGDETYLYDGGKASGPDVTINDRSGASADIDIQVVYSLDPSAAETLYADYGTQTNYTASYLSNDVRSVTREISGKYDTITMLTDRSQFTKAVQDALSKKWAEDGLHVEQVSVQDVRYPVAITDKYAEAQSAEIAKQKAINDQETAKVQAETKKKTAEVDAETKKINAQAEADANRILQESLSEEVLTQQYYETLKELGEKGNLVVVPEGSTPFVNIQKNNDTVPAGQ